MVSFKVVKGEPFWDKFEQYVELYNEGSCTVRDIPKKLDISEYKHLRYRRRAVDEGLISGR